MGSAIPGIAEARRGTCGCRGKRDVSQDEAIMTPQEAEELGVSVASAKQAISRNAPTTEGGTPEPIYPAIGTLETKHPLTVPSLPSAG